MARLEVEEAVSVEQVGGLLPWYVSWSGIRPRRPCGWRDAMIYILLWLLGAPLTLILILFLLGIGR